MISINNTDLLDDEWGFYVDIESVIINDNDNYKHMSKKEIFSTLEDISEEYEYYYNQQKEEKNLCICVNCTKNVIHTSCMNHTLIEPRVYLRFFLPIGFKFFISLTTYFGQTMDHMQQSKKESLCLNQNSLYMCQH